jgi:diguanylate cyclase (GGDEF)-like protein
MKNITLEKLIYKNYLKTSLASILFIELILVIIYFTVNNNMTQKSVNLILNDIQNNTYQLVTEKSKSIDIKITQLETFAKILQKEHQNFFENFEQYNTFKQVQFDFAKNGMYYKLHDNDGSSVVVSKDTPITQGLKKELIQSEIFDLTFKTLVNYDKDIVAAYFNSHKDYNRYYPFLKDVYDIFPSNIKMENYNFYYLANEKYNPTRDVVLTDIYLDPAKQGWLLSAIVPIYNKDKLEGVSGIDVTLNDFINSFININLPYQGKLFIIDGSGKIIAMSKNTKDMLNIKGNNNYTYKIDEKIDFTIYKSDQFSTLNYPDNKIVEKIRDIIDNKNYLHNLEVNGEKYLIFTNKMEKTSWYVISLINEKEALKDIRALENYYNKIGIGIILAIFFFYIIFFFFLRYKAKEFVRQINIPLLKIIDRTKDIGKNKDIKNLETCGIFEIDKLNSNFNSLINELDIRTNKLIIEETKRIYQENLANTDSLTGAFNRRYLNEFAIEYLRIIKREKTDLSLLMIDLDDFKEINDNFGHEMGDTVIKQLVSVSKDVIRENDLVVRFGGDEFLILLLNAKIVDARLVATKIVDALNESNKDKEFNFTVSIGVSQFKNDDSSIENMIKRADDCLYKAKKRGKNCIY